MPPRDIQAEIHVIQTHLQAIKSDPADAHSRADSIEQALEAIRARCESIRGHVAVPPVAGEAGLPATQLTPQPEAADAPRPGA